MEERVEMMRSRLEKLIASRNCDLLDPIIIETSQTLDKLLNMYNKL